MAVVIGKELAGVEDILFGMTTVIQTRQGIAYSITMLNSSHVPHSDTESIGEHFDFTDDKLAEFDTAIVAINAALDQKSDINHTHDGVYEPVDATILKNADIGVSVEAYDATILKDADIGVNVQAYEDYAVVAEDNAIDFTEKNFELTATAANITAVNVPTDVKEGTILVHNAENITGWGAEFKFKTVPTDLTGDEAFSYFVENATTIWIGRVQ